MLAKKQIFLLIFSFVIGFVLIGGGVHLITKHAHNQPALAISVELIENGKINATAAKSLYNNHEKGTTFVLCGQEYKVAYVNGDTVTAWATGYVHEMVFDSDSYEYKGSDVENYLVNTFYPSMCTYGGDIKSILDSLIVSASQASGNGAFNSARVWLPSEEEVKIGGTWGFTAEVDRKTALGNESLEAWLRSYFFFYPKSYVSSILAEGGSAMGVPNVSRGVRPAFKFSISALNSLTKVTISLNKAGGTGGNAAIQATYGEPMPASVSIPTRTGYDFAGYYTAPNGTGEQYYNATGASTGKTYPASGGPTTLYAHWTPAEYTLNFNSNGGNIPSPTSKKVYYNSAYGSLATATRTGYTFAGWYTDPAAGTKIETTTTYTTLGDSTVYAHWSGVNFSVAYNPNKPANASAAVSGSMTNSSHIYGTNSTLKSNAFTLTGWTFAGWATSPAGGVVYANGASATTLSTTSTTVNLYAVWTANTYTIYYNGNGATGGATANSTHTYDASSALAINGFVRAKYTFLGWSTNSVAATPTYADGQSVINLATSGSVTLFAVWEATKYNVTIKSITGGAVVLAVNDSITTQTKLPIDSALKFLALPNSGYAFVGWIVSGVTLPAEVLSKNSLEFSLTNNVTIEPIFTDSLVKGVAVTSTIGGIAYILGDNFENLGDDDTVTFCTKLALSGYKFSHWQNSAGEILGTADSIKLKKADVMNEVVKAVWVPIDSDGVNDIVDNISS